MKEQFIPFPQALELKQLGFDEECLGYYYKHGNSNKEKFLYNMVDDEYDIEDVPYVLNSKTITDTPLWQQAFDWLFKKFSCICVIDNSLNYEQKREKLEQAIRYIQNNQS